VAGGDAERDLVSVLADGDHGPTGGAPDYELGHGLGPPFADLTGAKLTGANLTDADLADAQLVPVGNLR
jgi:hypothetical protein